MESVARYHLGVLAAEPIVEDLPNFLRCLPRAELLADAGDDYGVVGSESIQKRVLRVELKLAHLAAKSEEEVVGDGTVHIHEQYDHPGRILATKEGCQGQLVQSAEVPGF